MKVLVIGSGGREHALAWKLAQSAKISDIIIAPGNAGTAKENKCRNMPIKADDIQALLHLAQTENVALTVVGPEVPLVAGIVDLFAAHGLRIFGPTKSAAQLEGSKAFAKAFLIRHNIPTAHYAVFNELNSALDYVRTHGAPIVIKADGLAAGKGVVVAMTLNEAEEALHAMLSVSSSSQVVIEDYLSGEEASFIIISDGKTALPLATSQDHKRVGEGDTGANTGGMGAYSPAPVVTPEVHNRIMQSIIQPTLSGMAADGIPFTGFLYAGLMIDDTGLPKVIEFNVRLGDPETQPILMRLQSDLVELIEAALDEKLNAIEAQWNPQPALGVVMAAQPYPQTPITGELILGLDNVPEIAKVFHAGTALNKDNQVISAGGRVLCVTALGENIAQAQHNAYTGVSAIDWPHAFYRKDIGWRALSAS